MMENTELEKAPQLGGEQAQSGREPMLPTEAVNELNELREYIEYQVRAAMDTRQEIIEIAYYYYEMDDNDIRRSYVEPMVDAALTRHYEDQKKWGITDCDWLDNAFEALNQRGIAARQHYSCCQTCGSAEIWDEMRGIEEIRGYTFYHMQDTESAAQGHGLYLSYGAIEDGEQAMIDIAWQVVNVLRQHGLTTAWNGNPRSRIIVNLDWKRRRVVEELTYAA